MIDDTKYAYYCPKCHLGTFKTMGEHFCSRCGKPLLDLKMRREDYEALAENEKNLKIREAEKQAREVRKETIRKMTVTTTPAVEGHIVKEYLGPVFGEVSEGISVFREFNMGFTGMTGGRSASFEECVINARNDALNEMKQRALDLGANAVIGVKVDYESFGQYLLVNASGTAVVLE